MLTTFETSLQTTASELSEKHTLLKHTTEKTSIQRIDAATKILHDLERRLFDSERERVILRRETETLSRDLRIA